MPSLYALKPWYTRRLGPILDVATRAGMSPDLFTCLGVLAGIAAAAAIGAGCWVGAVVLLAMRLAGANLDGALARRRGVARPWGFVLNEIGDRTSDLAMFAGLAVLAYREGDGLLPLLCMLCACVAAGLPTFASLSLAGAGGPRLNGGPLGKTERCLLAVVATAFPALLVWIGAVMVVGSLVTVVIRLHRGRRLLARETPGPDAPATQAAPAGISR